MCATQGGGIYIGLDASCNLKEAFTPPQTLGCLMIRGGRCSEIAGGKKNCLGGTDLDFQIEQRICISKKSEGTDFIRPQRNWGKLLLEASVFVADVCVLPSRNTDQREGCAHVCR